MLGYIPKKKAWQLVRMYEELIRVDLSKQPMAWIGLCAEIGKLRRELGFHTGDEH